MSRVRKTEGTRIKSILIGGNELVNIEWVETRLVPLIDTARVVDGYENICESCDSWGEACETCGVSVPITSEYIVKEVKMCQPTICGIPVGNAYEIEL